jgi:hypothetical protein
MATLKDTMKSITKALSGGRGRILHDNMELFEFRDKRHKEYFR